MSNRYQALILPLALALLCFACNRNTSANRAAQDTPPVVKTLASTGALTFQGIDVSHHQNTVDWAKVRTAGKSFAFAKATEGIDWVDPTFSTNWAAMQQVGLVRGAYHFFVAKDDAEAQAQHFIATVQLEPGDLPPAVDVEVSDGDSVADIQAGVLIWLKTIEAHYGVKPILYSDETFLNQDLAEGFEAYPLWIAEYSEDAPTSIGSWTKWTFWQYSQTGEVDGVDGDVDVDKFEGTTTEWMSLRVPEKE